MLSDVECRALAEQYLLRLAEQSEMELVLLPSPFETSATFAFSMTSRNSSRLATTSMR